MGERVIVTISPDEKPWYQLLVDDASPFFLILRDLESPGAEVRIPMTAVPVVARAMLDAARPSGGRA